MISDALFLLQHVPVELTHRVMPGLVPGIHVFARSQGVDGRDTPGTKCPGAAMTA